MDPIPPSPVVRRAGPQDPPPNDISRLPVLAALVAAIALAAFGFRYGTYAAGGSDSSCYALMADAFASGHLQPSSALSTRAPWPNPSWTFAPGGFVPSPTSPAAAAPVCAPGFSLLLVPFVKTIGLDGVFWLTPLAGALLVWLSFLAARQLGGSAAGVMAAVLVAASPVVLFQVVQPMNDVTTAALWMGVFVAMISRRWFAAGICCGLALLVRPNLLPLAVIAGFYALLESPRAAAALTAGAAPFVLVIGWLNAELYGGPLRTGYGQAGNLFSMAVVPRNAARYLSWLVETQTVFPLLGFAAPFVSRGRTRMIWLALTLIVTTAAIYFAYTPFDDWSYLRFLLPAITLLLVLAATVASRVTSTFVVSQRRFGMNPPLTTCLIVAVLTTGLAYFSVRSARSHLAFTMHALEQRYRSAAIVVRDRLPPDAAILTTWDSGAIRFHAQREAIVWDALDPTWLDRGMDWLRQNGHPPFILVESWEEPRFRNRFGERSSVGNLDWPPKFEVDRVVRIYDPLDRARFLRGERVTTEYLWPLLKR